MHRSLSKKSKILAIDPGTRHMGVALFEDGDIIYHGVTTIAKRASPHEHLRAARKVVLRLISDFAPSVLAVEKAFFANNRNTALLNVLVDEIRAIGRRKGLTVIALAATTVRKAVCGNGRASKEDVARVVVSRFPELRAYISYDRKWKRRYHSNMFDAVALALAAANRVSRRP